MKIIFVIICIVSLCFSCIIRDKHEPEKIHYWSIADDVALFQFGSQANKTITNYLYNKFNNDTKGKRSYSSIEPRNNGNALHFYSSAHNYWILRSSDDIKYIQLDYPTSWVSESGKILAWWDGDNNKVVFPEGNTIDMHHIGARERFLIYFESGGQYFALKDDSSEQIIVYENKKNLDKIITLTHPDREFLGSLRLYLQNDMLYCIYTTTSILDHDVKLFPRQDLVVHKINLAEKVPSYSTIYLSESEDHNIFNPYCHDFYGNRELVFLIDINAIKYPPIHRIASSLYVWNLESNEVNYIRNFSFRPMVVNKNLLLDIAETADIELVYLGELEY